MTAGKFNSFFALDVNLVRERTKFFAKSFNGRVLYAVKANPLTEIMAAALEGGAYGFDIASIPEAQSTIALAPGNRSFYMNPVKDRADISLSYSSHGIRTYVVDHMAELDKLFDRLPGDDPDVTIFLRLATQNTSAIFDLSSKFGASPAQITEMAQVLSKKTSWRIGLAFHVGSQTIDTASFVEAITLAENTIVEAGVEFQALDVGGGFPGDYLNSSNDSLEQTIAAINQTISQSSVLSKLEIYCEPGRALVQSCMSLFAKVQLRKTDMLYIAEGVYGGLLSSQNWLQFPAKAWRDGSPLAGVTQEYTIFGPTCDSLDKLGFPYALPHDITEGDWVQFENIGAYSTSLRTTFNGFYTSEIVMV